MFDLEGQFNDCKFKNKFNSMATKIDYYIRIYTDFLSDKRDMSRIHQLGNEIKVKKVPYSTYTRVYNQCGKRVDVTPTFNVWGQFHGSFI